MTDIQFGSSLRSETLFDRIYGWAAERRERVRRNHLRHAVDRFLNNLGDEQLSDIGISRSQLTPANRFAAMEPTNREMRRARF